MLKGAETANITFYGTLIDLDWLCLYHSSNTYPEISWRHQLLPKWCKQKIIPETKQNRGVFLNAF